MATQHLDLDEQEQIDQLKHFWKQYGNLISWVLLIVFGSLAAYNGWGYWQRHQANGASAMYEAVESAVRANDSTKLERALGDMRERFGSTAFAQQAGLLAARSFSDNGKPELAKAALSAVISKASDASYVAVARLHLAGLQIDEKAYEPALTTLTAIESTQYAGLAADRRGDVYMLQGKRDQARAEYEKAYAAISNETEYKRLLEAKLNALGVNARAKTTTKTS
jgi:predicted negative regulator of RcsB-dependent stress response